MTLLIFGLLSVGVGYFAFQLCNLAETLFRQGVTVTIGRANDAE